MSSTVRPTSQRATGPGAGARSRGLTLMEMLVAIVILSLLGGVLWQSLAQMARVERLLSSSVLDEPVDALRLQWVRRLIEAAMPAAPGELHAFRGERTRLEGLSSDAPGWPANTAAPVSLRLGQDSALGLYTLELFVGTPGQSARIEPIRLLAWQGGPGHFQYLAEDGTWHDQWPAQTLSPQDRQLPRMVAIRTGSAAWPLTLVHTRNSGLPRPSRQILEQF